MLINLVVRHEEKLKTGERERGVRREESGMEKRELPRFKSHNGSEILLHVVIYYKHNKCMITTRCVLLCPKAPIGQFINTAQIWGYRGDS
jgi:predicted molibdopterin-dependent oxidoreductase YjgC